MEKNLEFNKLADIVVWADGIIRDAGYNEEKYKSDGATAYCHVKAYELWRIRDVVLESMERRTVYSNALNNDIADKAAKIDLLEKEIEGRKEGYYALKELMDTKYISIDEHNNICEDFKNKIAELEKELADRNVKIRHQKENLDGINKTLEIRTKENESLIKVRNNLNKEIEAHESENARLSEKIKELKKERDKHMARVNDLRMELDCVKASKEKYEEAAHDKVVADLRESFNYWRTKCLAAQEEIEKLDGTIEEWKNKERIRTNELRATERKVEELWGLLNELKKEKKEGDNYAREGFKLYVKNTLAEAEGNKNEANEVITEAVRSAYAEWSKTQKEEETKKRLNEKFGVGGIVDEFKEETEIKGNGRTSSGRYPWGAKVNDIPCGEDAIE